MDVAVVYESMFGNTWLVAEAIAEGLRQADPETRVAVVPVGDATPDKVGGAGLLIVGGPTHICRMTSPASRKMALQAARKSPQEGSAGDVVEPAAGGPGVREWLDSLPKVSPGHRAAAFDTRLENPFAGGAARSIARRLRHRGYEVAARPQGFVVEDTQGPLREGECDRARAWAASLVKQPVR